MLMESDNFLRGFEMDLLLPHHQFSPFPVFKDSDSLLHRFTIDPLLDRSTGLEDYLDEFVNRQATSILSHPRCSTRSSSGSRTRAVLYTTELQKGDHISRPTDTASGYYDHHAIVIGRVHGSIFRIIHVTDGGGNGSVKYVSAVASSKSASAAVREEDEDFGKYINTGRLILYQYRPRECYEPDTVINRARRRVGAFTYNLLKNNCEHFARWCKTGRSESYQVQ